MATRALAKQDVMPSVFDDFFRPWSQWFNDTGFSASRRTPPAVNVSENENSYTVSLAAPGLKKEDFHIDLEGNMITISSEKEERKEDKDEKFTRKEYSYASFSRSFTLPDDVKQEGIDAQYENGVLNVRLPRKHESKKPEVSTKITVK